MFTMTVPRMARPDSAALSELTSEEIITECELNYIDYWRSATAHSTSEWSEDCGITRCVTGLPQEIFNVVLRSNLMREDADRCIDRVISEFRMRRIPLIWHVGRTSSPGDLGSYLEARGYPRDYDLIAMAADLRQLERPIDFPDRVKVRPCSTVLDCGDWIDCLVRSWDSPKEVGQWMKANPFYAADPPVRDRRTSSRVMYLGFLDGIPSGALMLFIARGVAGLQCVGTVGPSRRRGLAEAMVRTAMRDASERGHRFIVVLSTTEGVPLYEKAGFRRYGKLPEHSMYFDRPGP